jgi:hypothetical protein
MKATAFRPFERATLRGFATIVLDNGIAILDVALHERNGKRWCSPPSRPMIDKERRLVIGDDGKIKYAPMIEFVDANTRFRWSDAAVAAIDELLKSKAPDLAGAMSGGTAPERSRNGGRDAS